MSRADRRPAAIAVALAVVLGVIVVYLSALDPDERAPRTRVAPLIPTSDPPVAPMTRRMPPPMRDVPPVGTTSAVPPTGDPSFAAAPPRLAWPGPPPAPPLRPFPAGQRGTITGTLLDWAGEPVPDATITGCGSEAITDELGAYKLDTAEGDCEIWPFAVFGGVGVKGLSVIAHPAPGAVLGLDLTFRPDGFLVTEGDRTCLATSVGGYATAMIGDAGESGSAVPLLATPPDENDGDAVFAAVSAACRSVLAGN